MSVPRILCNRKFDGFYETKLHALYSPVLLGKLGMVP
jgi:hypothetical protein